MNAGPLRLCQSSLLWLMQCCLTGCGIVRAASRGHLEVVKQLLPQRLGEIDDPHGLLELGFGRLPPFVEEVCFPMERSSIAMLAEVVVRKKHPSYLQPDCVCHWRSDGISRVCLLASAPVGQNGGPTSLVCVIHPIGCVVPTPCWLC